ncbi:hypothetical protein [Brevibacterium sediminis]
MKQQGPNDRRISRKIRRDWQIHPALSEAGTPVLVALTLHDQTFFMPRQMAIGISNALVDAVETNKSTIYYETKSGKKQYGNKNIS